jgi:predicted lipid carrier protein YhbT
VEVRRLVRHASKSDGKVLRGIFKKALRVDGDAEAGLVLEQIAKDERVALTEVLRRTLLERRPSSRPAPAPHAEASVWSSLRLRSS